MNFNHIGNHFTADQTVINPIRPLTFSVTDIRTEISCTKASRISYPVLCCLYQFIQMHASRMAVSKRTFDHNLRFPKIGFLPPCTKP